MQTRTKFSEYIYVPYFKAVDEVHLTKDDYGQRLVYPHAYIVCRNNAYEVKRIGTDQVIEIISIKQNEAGADVENRIIRLKQYLELKPDVLFIDSSSNIT